MSELRQRRPVEEKAPLIEEPEEDDKSKAPKQETHPPDLEPSLKVMISLLVGFLSLIFFLGFYKHSNANSGAFATFINTHIPIINTYLNRDLNDATHPLFGAAAQSIPPNTSGMTELDLLAHDGTDPTKPLLLAINGTIFDVSASPAFYGPGGHYHHFAGRDASRAWVTECWDSPDQLTWRMDGIEAMFMPQWLDEQLEAAAKGAMDPKIYKDMKVAVATGVVEKMAKRAIEMYGTVDAAEIAERRVADKAEAEREVQAALGKWVSFFEGNGKYEAVGRVIYDEEATPAPPAICEEAMKKRPIKGGRLEPLMGTIGGMMGKKDKAGEGEEDASKGMPDFVRDNLKKAREVVEGVKDAVEDNEAQEKMKITKDAIGDIKAKLQDIAKKMEKGKGEKEHEEL